MVVFVWLLFVTVDFHTTDSNDSLIQRVSSSSHLRDECSACNNNVDVNKSTEACVESDILNSNTNAGETTDISTDNGNVDIFDDSLAEPDDAAYSSCFSSPYGG
jgi:hypothetical protein